MSTTFETVKTELPDKPCTCSRVRNVISKPFRLHISANLFVSTLSPIEYFVSAPYSAACTSLELLYYSKVLYFYLGLLRVIQSV